MSNVVNRDALKAFQSPIRGNDIMEICGLTEGRNVGKIKEAIEEAILDGIIENTFDDAKKYLLKIKDTFSL
jgi:hypothetical protein